MKSEQKGGRRVVIARILTPVALAVTGILVMVFAYELVFMVAPLDLDFADAFEDLAVSWDAVGFSENAAENRGYASQSRSAARENTIVGYIFGAVGLGLTLTSLGVGLGAAYLASPRIMKRMCQLFLGFVLAFLIGGIVVLNIANEFVRNIPPSI